MISQRSRTLPTLFPCFHNSRKSFTGSDIALSTLDTWYGKRNRILALRSGHVGGWASTYQWYPECTSRNCTSADDNARTTNRITRSPGQPWNGVRSVSKFKERSLTVVGSWIKLGKLRLLMSDMFARNSYNVRR